MEVVGSVASIGQIIDITIKVSKYLKDVKKAPDERKQLAVEATSLVPWLTHLQYRVEEIESPDSRSQGLRSIGMDNGLLAQYERSMVDLAEKLDPPSTKMRSLGRALVWTLRKEEVNRILSTIERLKSSIMLCLQRDQR
jgi:hypothetical protein